MTKKKKNIPPGKGGSPGQPYDAPKEDPKNPYVPAPKLAKKNKKTKPLTEKSDTPYGQPEKAKNPFDDRSNVV